MSKFPLSPANANIPIYLDTGTDLEPKRLSEHICPACETSSRDQPIHCVLVASPGPPSYNSITPRAPSPRNLTVPGLNLETRPQPPIRTLQFDPEGRPHVRFRRNAFSPLSPPSIANSITKDDIDWSRKSQVGLGIPDAPFMPDISPITPATAEKLGEERPENLQSASNFAQRIEEKLWKYSASGNVVKRWLIEIISWLLSAACMAGILAVLVVYKDKRIPNWPLGLTLNAYISVLSRIASAALLLPVSEALGQLKWSWFQGSSSKKMWDFELFDNASRGPWGSLLLLVRTKGKSLAALGAAVTLFALALDPFFQQVVQYPERWIQQGIGSIPRAITYEPFSAGKEYRVGMESLQLDQNMLGATYHHFYEDGTLPISFGKGVRAEIPLVCPNSNCTWPEYETLGICSKCADVGDLLEFKCVNSTLDWIQVPDVDAESGEAVFPNGTSCGWYLKSDDPVLMTGYNVDSDTSFAGEILMMRAQPLYDLFTRERLPGYTSRLNTTHNPLAHFVVASGRTVDHIQRNATPIAHECVLQWCAKTMLSTYSEGGYTENVTNIFVNETQGPSPWETSEILNEKGEPSGTEYTYVQNITVKGQGGNEYHIDNLTQVLTLSLFDDIFPSSYTLSNSTDEVDGMLRYKEYITVDVYTRNLTRNPWLFDNVTKHMDNLATAMTNVIRSSPSNTKMITGPAYDKESFVDVRWGWLSLPLGLLGLTFLFLIATVIRSSMEQDQVGVWKTSAIATLLYGLPDAMQKKMTASQGMGTPRAKAKEVRVKWLPRAGWRFSGNSGFSPTSTKSRHASFSPTALKRDYPNFSPTSSKKDHATFSPSVPKKDHPAFSPASLTKDLPTPPAEWI
ncbi:hypothetical protein BDV95DRAFT_140700 [Massariosphaeria phaeospora]|uniref:DUF3176 domain containing protein n=1 Tax=Massariosphaeria phaeospora TaxID=100035 RepID=A0A7C8MHS0_9PLEO|nr:hypothetical protein BDV95DRAFT_140700 [Massariosphaeria phaeospora]